MSRAQARWKLLSAALAAKKDEEALKKMVSSMSVRRHSGYSLIPKVVLPPPTDDPNFEIHSYRLPSGISLNLYQRRFASISLSEILGEFDNTGNIGCWTAEEVMAHYCLSHPELTRGRAVLELGAGCALTSLALCTGSAENSPREVIVTDGNESVVEVIRRNAAACSAQFTCHPRVAVLPWASHPPPVDITPADVILLSDCFFFEKEHHHLAQLLVDLVGPHPVARPRVVLAFAPARGGSLHRFLDIMAAVEHAPETMEVLLRYDETVWARHQEALRKASPQQEEEGPQQHQLATQPSGKSYEPDLHYPLMAFSHVLAAFVYILLIVFFLVGLSILVENYLEESIEVFIKRWKIPPDIAGAALLALANAAPEIAICLFSVNLHKNPELGLSTVVGSAVFSFTTIFAAAFFAMKESPTPIAWPPIARDFAVYAIAILILVLLLCQGTVYWYESLLLLLCYPAYIGLLKGWEFVTRRRHPPPTSPTLAPTPAEVESTVTLVISPVPPPVPPGDSINRPDDEEVKMSPPLPSEDVPLLADDPNRPAAAPAPDGGDGAARRPPKPKKPKVKVRVPCWLRWAVAPAIWPWRMIWRFTCPNPKWTKKGGWAGWYYMAFVLSLGYVAGLTFIVTFLVQRMVTVFGIASSFFGLTLLGVGSDMADVVNSVAVSRKGHLQMALAGGIGEQILNIFVGLGLPWLLYSACAGGAPVVLAGNFTPAIVVAVAGVAVVGLVGLAKWRGYRWHGVVLTLLYGAFLVYEIVAGVVLD
ncbi:sodium/potassium/calcium exchanger [Paratrimastix pyriformis]|uniref:Sodium/potassium/calcium exchanger n=1 Tax=Paratrimastix pyriformis TaxID=342808 RepID=A0ABQ8USM9_9EUKA|nr:sodium/potassium/calcium exchanger [Paratrimastix pyriformis]